MGKLFGTDGVRGQAGTFLDAMTALKLAQAVGIYFKKHLLLVLIFLSLLYKILINSFTL